MSISSLVSNIEPNIPNIDTVNNISTNTVKEFNKIFLVSDKNVSALDQIDFALLINFSPNG
jgi:hypothetical protein